MKFSRYNNPRKRRHPKAPTHSAAYRDERTRELHELLAKAKTDAERDALIKAYRLSIQ